jgi:hypothetical protein
MTPPPLTENAPDSAISAMYIDAILQKPALVMPHEIARRPALSAGNRIPETADSQTSRPLKKPPQIFPLSAFPDKSQVISSSFLFKKERLKMPPLT